MAKEISGNMQSQGLSVVLRNHLQHNLFNVLVIWYFCIL